MKTDLEQILGSDFLANEIKLAHAHVDVVRAAKGLPPVDWDNFKHVDARSVANRENGRKGWATRRAHGIGQCIGDKSV